MRGVHNCAVTMDIRKITKTMKDFEKEISALYNGKICYKTSTENAGFLTPPARENTETDLPEVNLERRNSVSSELINPECASVGLPSGPRDTGTCQTAKESRALADDQSEVKDNVTCIFCAHHSKSVADIEKVIEKDKFGNLKIGDFNDLSSEGLHELKSYLDSCLNMNSKPEMSVSWYDTVPGTPRSVGYSTRPATAYRKHVEPMPGTERNSRPMDRRGKEKDQGRWRRDPELPFEGKLFSIEPPLSDRTHDRESLLSR